MDLPKSFFDKLKEREFITSLIIKAVGVAAILGFITPEQQTQLTGLWAELLNNLDTLIGTVLLIADQVVYTNSRTKVKTAALPQVWIDQTKDDIKTGEGGEHEAI